MLHLPSFWDILNWPISLLPFPTACQIEYADENRRKCNRLLAHFQILFLYVEWLQRKALHLTSSTFYSMNVSVTMFNASVTPSSSPAKIRKKRVKDCWCILWVQLCILLALWVSKALDAVSVTNRESCSIKTKANFDCFQIKNTRERRPILHFWFSGALKLADISYQVPPNQPTPFGPLVLDVVIRILDISIAFKAWIFQTQFPQI